MQVQLSCCAALPGRRLFNICGQCHCCHCNVVPNSSCCLIMLRMSSSLAMSTLQPANHAAPCLPLPLCLLCCKNIECFNAQGGFECVAAHWRAGRLWFSLWDTGAGARRVAAGCVVLPIPGLVLPSLPSLIGCAIFKAGGTLGDSSKSSENFQSW